MSGFEIFCCIVWASLYIFGIAAVRDDIGDNMRSLFVLTVTIPVMAFVPVAWLVILKQMLVWIR